MADTMPSRGSLLLDSLGRAFGDILRKDFERELEAEKKKDSEPEVKKPKKGEKKEDKEKAPAKKEVEQKRVIREGYNSLITHPNASCFSVFSHVRHLVLQNQLCETYNARLNVGDEEEGAGEKGREASKKEQIKMPVIVGLGVRGVFAIIRDVWHTNTDLCVRALKEFLHILEGQEPFGLRNEPKETTTALFDLLMEMVRSSREGKPYCDLDSVASACLLSLVIAVGDTGKMLQALTTMLTQDQERVMMPIPEIFNTLQTCVQAVLLGGTVTDMDWSSKGILAKSCVEEWPLEEWSPQEKGVTSGMASDGLYLYLHGSHGLVKVGSGYGNTKKGHVYMLNKQFHPHQTGWLGFISGKLLYFPLGQGDDTITVVDVDTLQAKGSLELSADSLGRHCLFTNGTALQQIRANKEGGFALRTFDISSPVLPCVDQRELHLSQKSVLRLGPTKFDTESSMHTVYQDSIEQVVRVLTAKYFTAVQTASGKLLYTGNGSVFGLTGDDVLKGEWSPVELPDKGVKVEHSSCDNAGSFCLIVSDKGVVYFGGTNKKGESGEEPGRQQKPMKLRRMAKMKDQEVAFSACGGHSSALVTRDGKLYLFGGFDEDITDKSGVVVDLLGVPVSQVAMGRSHTCILTQDGRVFTFGNNQYGQCGRNFVAPKEEDGGVVAEEEEEESSSEEEGGDSGMCPKGEHTWNHAVCMMCKFCGFCTGYGPNCCNEGLPGRGPGSECGCGNGDSGCSVCGCCQVCAGEKDSWGGDIHFGVGGDLPVLRRMRDAGGKHAKDKKKKKEKKKEKRERKEKKEKKEDKEKGEMGLQLLFGNAPSDAEVGKEEIVKEGGAEKAEDLMSTKKPKSVELPEQDMTVMQMDCGSFHTAILLHSGDVYVFGNGNHGQLGQGNNLPSGKPVKVPLPAPATQVACGDNHTVVLLQTGKVYTFGKYQEGQLGRQRRQDEGDNWHMSPGEVPLRESWKSVSIAAQSNQTFINVDESLVTEGLINKCKVFANSHDIGIVVSSQSSAKSYLVIVDSKTLQMKKFDGEDQQDLQDRSVCLDPEYNILWSYSALSNQVSCFNPAAMGIKDPTGTILSSSICLPRSKEAHIPRSHASLNLLSCLQTLATTAPGTPEKLATSVTKKYPKDDFLCVTRFTSHGGGWGYSASSVEAVRFSPSADILLGGFGLYGGRGTYNAEIRVYNLGEAGGDEENEPEGTLLASTTATNYTCDRQQTYRVFFDKPVLLSADHWYLAYASISSPQGASSDAGSSGQASVSGPEKVDFKFKGSKKSNNGTDPFSGQIPELLYRQLEFDEEEKAPSSKVQLLSREFACSVSPGGISAVLELLNWSWSHLTRNMHDHASELQRFAFIAKATLGLLKTYIQRAYPVKGQSTGGVSDSTELSSVVNEAKCLLKLVLSSHDFQLHMGGASPIESVVSVCKEAFLACFDAFYPSLPLKWYALCEELQSVDPSDVFAGMPRENLLSTVLEALSGPAVSYIGLGFDTDVTLASVLHNSEVEGKYPILSEYMQMKTLEEAEGGVLLPFNIVAAKLLAIVTVPVQTSGHSSRAHISPVVEKAGQLLLSRINELALCAVYSETSALAPLSGGNVEHKEKIFESPCRFSTKLLGLPSLEVKEVIFSVNKAITIHGYSVYCGADMSRKYKITLQKGDEVLASSEGKFSNADFSGEFVNLTFKAVPKLEAEVVYKAHVELSGSSFDIGTGGDTLLSSPGGVDFTLHHTGSEASNPETGHIARFLYSLVSPVSVQNVIELSVHLATTMLEVTVGFLQRLLDRESDKAMLEVLGRSFLFSTLLPTTLAQLGPLACRQPKYAVQVLDLVRNTLPMVLEAYQQLTGGQGIEEGKVYSDTKHRHYAVIETEHPYKQACVTHHKVTFSSKVQWMSIEFDPRTGFAQKEDKIAELLVSRHPKGAPTFKAIGASNHGNGNTNVVSDDTVVLTFDDLYMDWERYALEYPPGMVILPGNEVHISTHLDTEYEKKDSNNHFGFKLQVIGYEWSTEYSDCLKLLQKELVSLGAVCASTLLRDDVVLPYTEELSIDSSGSSEKADMRIVQAAAQEVLAKYPQVLGRGLLVETPKIADILSGEIALVTSNEQEFLKDFIESKSSTAGGRLARWLQPNRAVDPEASELKLPCSTPSVGLPAEFQVLMKDQKLKPIHVEGMKVEVKAAWLGREDGREESWKDKAVDETMGVRKPTFSGSYHPTQSGPSCLYHSITMMMPYSDYSFEELRLFAPKLKGSMESFSIKDNKDGTYMATWVPSAAGTYLLQVYIDGNAVGKEEKVKVIETDVPNGRQSVDDASQVEKSGDQLITKPKLKRVPSKIGGGVRVRPAPSCNGDAIGLAPSNATFHYVEELENETGTWVKLSADALKQFSCRGPEGYALAYSKEKAEAFLEEVEPTLELATEVSSSSSSSSKSVRSVERKGGSGSYSLFQCGSAGHNVRSKPALQAAPIGRLLKGNKIEVVEELENDCGVWLKLSKESAKKYCEGGDADHAWTLAVAPSGKAFLVMEGDANYQDLQLAAITQATPVPTTNFPTAAQVFGTVQKSSFLSIPVAPPPPVFQFGSASKQPKLLFGARAEEGTIPAPPPPPPLPPPALSFKFTATKTPEKKGPSEKEEEQKEGGEKAEESPDEKISFSVGSGGRAKVARRRRGRSSCSPSRSSSPDGQRQGAEGSTKAEAMEAAPKEESKALPSPPAGRQALSPAMAECQRAIFAAFLWHEGLVHDAIASSSYLKFHPELTLEMRENMAKKAQVTAQQVTQKQASDEAATKPEEVPSVVVVSAESDLGTKTPTLPATLNYLVTFWEELSGKVLETSAAPFTPPKVPALAHELLKRYEEEKAALEKRKKEKENKVAGPVGGGGGGGGTTICELCDQSFPDPVTYHMKEVHPGCGKHASGWGYNSRGSFCSGWAGNCGDGGRGGSTWYLMCKDCHKKYTTLKQEKGKKSVKAVPMPKMKTRKPGKPRTLPVTNVVQGMTQNAKFLLEIGSAVEQPGGPPGPSRQTSTTSELSRQGSIPQPPAASAEVVENKPPMYRRAISMFHKDEESGGPSSSLVSQMSLDESSGPVDDADMLITKPSLTLKKLMYNRSKHSQKKPDTNDSSRVLPFVVHYHDLDGLRASMKHTMRRAGVKAFAMEFLEWLLKEAKDPSVIHDLLWLFNCALVEHPMQQMAAAKAKEKDDQKDQKGVKPDEIFLSKHPLTSLEGAGVMLGELRKHFHSFLQTVSNMMPTFPMGSAVQEVAMQCWCLTFQPQDHSFLIQSNVFANISKALSGVDGAEESEETKIKDKDVEVFLMEDAVPKGQLEVSSNEAMAASLTDGSTETFWESRDEPRGKPRHITLTFPSEQKLYAVAVHIDNQKDAAQQVDGLALLIGRDEDSLKEVARAKVSLMHTGWKCLRPPGGDKSCMMVRVEVTSPQNSVRVRQIQVLVHPSKGLDCALSSVVAQQKACEAQALRVFRLLTSQVFGGLLVSKAPKKGGEEVDAATPPEDGEQGGESVEHMVDILDVKYNKFSNLQKQVCMHVIQSVHTEMERMKDEWEGTVGKAPPSKPAERAAQEASSGKEAKSSDSYCFELLSMVTRLSQSDLGCEFLSKQDKLVQDLFALLHIATVRIQLQVCALLYRILPVVGPQRLRDALRVPLLPPIGYSAIAEAVNSAASVNQLGILDCLLGVISKALSVQVKAKGRFPNVLQSLVGDTSTTAVTLLSLLNPKPVMGESTVRMQRWYMRGPMSQEVAFEVVKLIKEMTKGALGNQWQGIVKAAVGQAVLHLTKVHESVRVPDPGMHSQTLWLSLAALCVIDEEHAEALSSGQWLGKDGKPKAKPMCDNHDDGETQALILCDKCGNLCGECDRVLHYKKSRADHQRQVFKEEEEAVKVDLHEGCGRIKLYWTMAVADYRTLKAMIEFRETAGGSKGTCRFCGTSSNTGLLPVGYVCSDPECQERAQNTCDKTLSCGHMCCGVKGEEKCLPCLHACPSEAGGKLKQDADDMCMICYTEGLSCAPVIQLGCGHMFHYHCCRKALTKRWSGPRIAFRFMFCSICTNTPISHPNLADVLDPSRELYEDVKRKCLLRLEFESQMKCEALTSPTSKFYQKPLEYAMWKYAYYVCYKCKKAYFGGEAHCAEAVAGNDEYNAAELVCPSCSNVGGAVQLCPKHGTDFLEYKCRYCCSVAVYFCFGTTHFCGPCHDDFQRLTSMPVSELPQCPVGPRAKPLEGAECPLHVKHPPNGEEFALGCGVCRNAQTF